MLESKIPSKAWQFLFYFPCYCYLNNSQHLLLSYMATGERPAVLLFLTVQMTPCSCSLTKIVWIRKIFTWQYSLQCCPSPQSMFSHSYYFTLTDSEFPLSFYNSFTKHIVSLPCNSSPTVLHNLVPANFGYLLVLFFPHRSFSAVFPPTYTHTRK